MELGATFSGRGKLYVLTYYLAYNLAYSRKEVIVLGWILWILSNFVGMKMRVYIGCLLIGLAMIVASCLSLEKVDSLKAKRDVRLSNIEKRDVL